MATGRGLRGALPHEVRRNVAGAIYGLILGSSIIAAAGADHPNQAGLVEIYLCVTAVVFYLAHAYAGVLGSWIEGEPPSLLAGVVLACRRVRATRSQATVSIAAGALFAAIVIFLKVFVHG